jgi:hypothetical protein
MLGTLYNLRLDDLCGLNNFFHRYTKTLKKSFYYITFSV